MSSEEERARLSPAEAPGSCPGSRPNSRPSSPSSSLLRNQQLPKPGAVGAALQNTVEDLINRDLDTGVVVNLSNSEEAHRKLQDLLPVHYFSWELKNVEAALIYTLLHMFVLLGQHGEIVRERATYQEYISKLKNQVSQLEDELSEQRRQTGADQHKDELLRLRKENAELRCERAKLQASQNELFQINDAWSRDYNSLTRKIDALTTGNWTNTSEISTNGTTAPNSDEARTPTHPPSLTHTPLAHHTSAPCTKCCSLQEQVAELNRQVREFARKNDGLEKSMAEIERKLQQRELMIRSLDSENQAVQLQIQEIGDLRAAARMKEDFRKLEIQMKQKEKQYQDVVTQKVLLQQQVDKLRVAFMSIFGVVNGSSRRHSAALHHDCRGHCYMSEPLPPPPTPPGLIARGNHFGSLVEKDRQRMLYDEQVTGFERAAPTNLSLPTDPHSWPKVTKRTPRPNTLIPKSNGHQSTHRYVACPTCSTHFDIEGEMAFSKMFDHISYCGPKR